MTILRSKEKPLPTKYGRLVCITGKAGFRTESLALQRMQEHNERPTTARRATTAVRAYQCAHCPWWHLTSREYR